MACFRKTSCNKIDQALFYQNYEKRIVDDF